MNAIDPQIITKLDEIRSLVSGNPLFLSLSVSVDPGGTSYAVNVSDSEGNSNSISQRIANS